MATASGRFGALAAALVFAASARADSATPARAVIRGTGSDVHIVYETPRSGPTDVRASITEDPVAAALRRKTSGENDAAIVAFLRMHQAALPEVIESEVVNDFRRAGAGEDVISALLSFAAVDIGVTAEDGPGHSFAPASEVGAGAYPDLAGMGYPFYSSYGSGYFAGDFGYGGFGKNHFGRSPTHGFRAGSGFSFRKPFFPKPHFSGARPERTRAGRPASRPKGIR